MNSVSQTTYRFGIHRVDSVAFLIQQEGSQNLLSSRLIAPMVFKGRRTCPHNFDINQVVRPPDELLTDALFQAMSPAPVGRSEKCKVIVGKDELVETLSRLSNPLGPLITPIWLKQPRTQISDYELTNITPAVYSRVVVSQRLKSIEMLAKAKSGSERPMLMITDAPVFSPWISPIKTNLNVTVMKDLPLEKYGNWLIAQHMKEEND